jgi:hypothetical protein
MAHFMWIMTVRLWGEEVRSGRVEEWRSGEVEEWRSGGVEKEF